MKACFRLDLLSIYLGFTTRPRPKSEKVFDAAKEILAEETNVAGTKVLKCCNLHRLAKEGRLLPLMKTKSWYRNSLLTKYKEKVRR